MKPKELQFVWGQKVLSIKMLTRVSHSNIDTKKSLIWVTNRRRLEEVTNKKKRYFEFEENFILTAHVNNSFSTVTTAK